MKNNGKNSKGNAKSELRKDRKLGTGLSGSLKKGEHGGKFTWSADEYSQAVIGFVKDPNFEDPEEIATIR